MRFLLACSAMVLLPLATHADGIWEDAFDRYEQQKILAAELEEARSVGGYNDPFTAFANILSGTATSKDVTLGINHFQDVQGYQGIKINRSGEF